MFVSVFFVCLNKIFVSNYVHFKTVNHKGFQRLFCQKENNKCLDFSISNTKIVGFCFSNSAR